MVLMPWLPHSRITHTAIAIPHTTASGAACASARLESLNAERDHTEDQQPGRRQQVVELRQPREAEEPGPPGDSGFTTRHTSGFATSASTFAHLLDSRWWKESAWYCITSVLAKPRESGTITRELPLQQPGRPAG